MSPTRLSVPYLPQRQEGECVVACAMMLLKHLGVSAEYDRLLQLFGTQHFGTFSSQIRKLESLDLAVIYKHGTFDELAEHLANNRPCIAFVMTGELPYWTDNTSHAVVVVGLDDDFIYLHDPDFKQDVQVARGDFDLAWLEWDEMYATVMKK